MKKRGVLGHHADLLAQLVLRHGSNIASVDQDAPTLHVVEAQENIQNCRLASTGSPDQTDLLPGFHGEIEILQDAALLAVMEGDFLEADLTLLDRQRIGLALIHHLMRLFEGRHSVADRTDIFEKRRDLPHDPLAHAMNA